MTLSPKSQRTKADLNVRIPDSLSVVLSSGKSGSGRYCAWRVWGPRSCHLKASTGQEKACCKPQAWELLSCSSLVFPGIPRCHSAVSADPLPGFDSVGLSAIQIKSHCSTNLLLCAMPSHCQALRRFLTSDRRVARCKANPARPYQNCPWLLDHPEASKSPLVRVLEVFARTSVDE